MVIEVQERSSLLRERSSLFELDEVSTQRSSIEVIAASSELRFRLDEKKTKRQKKQLTNEDSTENMKQELVMDEHLVDLEQLVHDLSTDSKRGMTIDDANNRLKQDGLNILTPPKSTPEWVKFLRELTGLFSLLLWFGAILCYVSYSIDGSSESLALGVVLTFVVLASGIFSYIQNRKSSNLMESFKNMLPTITTVIRNGSSEKLDAKLLVRGDLIALKGGDKVPADVRIVSCSDDMQVDNASLTGESEPLKRTIESSDENPLETSNLCFFGTFIPQGSCTALVLNTGDRTIMGRIAKLATATGTQKTPIAKEIDHFVHVISAVALVIGVIFFCIGFVVKLEIIPNIVGVLGIIVANVPEGLLVTVTVCLTLTANRMAHKYVLVKDLESVETLGSITCICSDKTGTLTQNIMTVANVVYDNAIFDTGANPQSFQVHPEFTPNDISFQALQRCAILCNNAVFDEGSKFEKENDNDDKTKGLQLSEGKPIPFRQTITMGDGTTMSKVMWQTIGDASESALIKFAQQRMDVVDYRNLYRKVKEIPFNSRNKYQVSIHEQDREDSKEFLLVMKGAPERILSRCKYMLLHGNVVELTENDRAEIEGLQLQLSKKGMRVLGFCEKILDSTLFPYDYNFNTENPNFPLGENELSDISHPNVQEPLCFLGLMALIDPPRPQVPSAISKCKSAGIKVIMVTGDHPETAKSIAYDVGILWGPTKEDMEEHNKVNNLLPSSSGYLDPSKASAIVVPGWDISVDTDQKEWDRILDHDQIVFARTSPQQKLLIVENAQRRDEIVAVTGDGVNDSPALKKSDIGIAMGIMGSEVSKEAADMILLDDNFASIVAGIEEGRLIFDNLKKSIAYTLSSNIPELAPFLLFVAIGIPIPLTTILILGVDLGTDMIPAISFAYEFSENDIMLRSPRNAKTDHLVTKKLISFAYCQIGVMQTLAGFFTWLIVLSDYGYPPSILPGLGRNDLWGTQVLWCKVDGGEYCPMGGKQLDINLSENMNCVDDYETTADDIFQARVFWRPGKNNGRLLDCQYPLSAFLGSKSAPQNFNKYDISSYKSYTKGLPQVTYQSMQIAWDLGYRPYTPYKSRMSSFFDYNWLRWDVTSNNVDGLGDVTDAIFFKYQPIGTWGLTSTKASNQEMLGTDARFKAFGNQQANLTSINDTNILQTPNLVTLSSYGKTYEEASLGFDTSTCSGVNCLLSWKSGFALKEGSKVYLNVLSRMMQKEALCYSQAAYFVSIVLVQWADLLICKTRWLSIITLGMRNSVMNFGLYFETLLAAVLCYSNLFSVVGMRPIRLTHWFGPLPFTIFIVAYDELRKYLMRKTSTVITDKDTGRILRKAGWLERNTYY